MDSSRTHLLQKITLLSWFTIIYNFVEGAFSITLGAQDDSIALLGFGVDSWIEVLSASLVLWRFKNELGRAVHLSNERERKAIFGIGILFILLSIGTAIGSIFQLIQQSHPQTTLPGLIVSVLSLSFMYFLWSSKKAVGIELNSKAVLKDAECSLACIYLSAILFIGSLTFLVFPNAWWIDSVAALLLALFIFREGFETVQSTRKEDFSGGCGCSHE